MVLNKQSHSFLCTRPL
uniref:Uncharacterized protein n=1 Tax=Rhizophora mucronata TaxID=61149 RepID=A0A2P2JTR5_RHIMU